MVFDYRRQSAFRTISGGMICGFTLRVPAEMQLLLLGYQRTVKSLNATARAAFLVKPNIIDPFADE